MTDFSFCKLLNVWAGAGQRQGRKVHSTRQQNHGCSHESAKIENLNLQEKFLKAQRDLRDPLPIPEWLFYGGSDELLAKVVNKGFRAADKKVRS